MSVAVETRAAASVGREGALGFGSRAALFFGNEWVGRVKGRRVKEGERMKAS